MDARMRNYCNTIVQCLIRYGGLEETEARRLVDESKLCEPRTDIEREMLFHEESYYWAMHLLHASENAEWYQDPTLWPPPDDYYDRLKEWYEKPTDS